MKKKRITKLQRIDKYLYKNSYLYKAGKKILRTKTGKTVSILLLSYFTIVFAINYYKKSEVISFVRNWQSMQNRGNYSEFISCIDMSEKNVYKASFPDWKELFFEEGIKLSLKEINVSIERNGKYIVNLKVEFRKDNKIINKFNGDIFIIKKSGKFKIYRLRT
jgi:hypothetical protein